MRTATIYNFLLEANIMASIAILLMIPFRKLSRKHLGSTIFCFAWLLVALRLLCPLALPNPVIHEIHSPFVEDAAIRPIAGQIQVRVRDAASSLNSWAYVNTGRDSALVQATGQLTEGMWNASISILLMKIYLAGVILTLLWFVFSNVRFRMKLRAGRIEPISGKLLDQYTEMCKARKAKPIPVYFTDPLASACLVGVFKPYIALPLTAAPQTAIQVLSHEISHYQGKDHLFGLARLACCAVHWFNPLVWLAAAMSRTDMELRCDERATRGRTAEDKKAYAETLVLAAARRNAPGTAILATGMTMTGRKLKNRVLAIVGDQQRVKWLGIGFGILASILLICAFATAEPQNAAPMPLNIEYYMSGYKSPGLEQPIMQNKDAIAHANRLWRAVIPDNEVPTWMVESDAVWVAMALNGQHSAIGSLEYERYGLLLRFERVGWNSARFSDNRTNLPLAEEQLAQVCRAAYDLLEQWNPGTVQDNLVLAAGNEAFQVGGIHYFTLVAQPAREDQTAPELYRDWPWFFGMIDKDGSIRFLYYTSIGNG